MTDVTLEALRTEADTEAAPVKVVLADGSEAVLPLLLRLSQTARDTVRAQLADLDTIASDSPDDADRRAHLICAILRTVADKGEQLVAELNGDVVVTDKVLDKWKQASGLGDHDQA